MSVFRDFYQAIMKTFPVVFLVCCGAFVVSGRRRPRNLLTNHVSANRDFYHHHHHHHELPQRHHHDSRLHHDHYINTICRMVFKKACKIVFKQTSSKLVAKRICWRIPTTMCMELRVQRHKKRNRL